jgi:hypothetical protein
MTCVAGLLVWKITAVPEPSEGQEPTAPQGRSKENSFQSGRFLDRAAIIVGKCDLSNGSGKSPGLNQFAFG